MFDLDVVLERSFRPVFLLALDALNELTPYLVITHQFLEFSPVLLLLSHLLRAPGSFLDLDHLQRLDLVLKVGHPSVEFCKEFEILDAG